MRKPRILRRCICGTTPEDVHPRSGWLQASVSSSGTLVYVSEGISLNDLSLVWVDERGETSPAVTELRNYSDPVLSPDSKRVAVHVQDEPNDIWVVDLERGGSTRITFSSDEDETPAWSPDGRELAYVGGSGGERVLYRKFAGGGASTVEREIWRSPQHFHVTDWSSDGRTIVVQTLNGGSEEDVVAIDAETGAKTALLTSSFNENGARLSPDGKWLAYSSDESGRYEVYVQSYPALDSRVGVSVDGGIEPVWAATAWAVFLRPSEPKGVCLSVGGGKTETLSV